MTIEMTPAAGNDFTRGHRDSQHPQARVATGRYSPGRGQTALHIGPHGADGRGAAGRIICQAVSGDVPPASATARWPFVGDDGDGGVGSPDGSVGGENGGRE